MLKYITIALLLASCASTPPKVVEAPPADPSPIQPVTVAAVGKPANPTCTRRYVALDLDIYTQCILDGMSFVTVSNIIGFPGTPVSSSGNAASFQWRYDDGLMMATFVDDRLVSKAQTGLEACTRNCQ
jgi:hypothetical protein